MKNNLSTISFYILAISFPVAVITFVAIVIYILHKPNHPLLGGGGGGSWGSEDINIKHTVFTYEK